jgi:hypothetical protein
MEQKTKTLKQEAQEFEPTAKTKNISDLSSVSTALILEDDSFSFTEKDGREKTVIQKVVLVNGEKYRVPMSVIGSLKVILEDNPNLKTFKVKKTGEGKEGTKYTVIPLS